MTAGFTMGFHQAFLPNSLRTLNSVPKRLKQTVLPFVPILIRLLLVSVFVEDAFTTLLQHKAHVQFFATEYTIPAIPAHMLIAVTTLATFQGAAMLFVKDLEALGVHLLIAATLYQQTVYGRHSPITAGNVGFLLRNLCLIGTLALLAVQSRLEQGFTVLPGLSRDSEKKAHGPEEHWQKNVVAFATRLLIVLLCGEMCDAVSRPWVIVIAPVALAVLVGYRTNAMGLCLLVFYSVATVSSKQFWFVDSVFERDVMRFEFCQTASILSGLLLLSVTGPGDISVDSRMKKV